MKDWAVLEIMLTGIAVGAIGFHGLVDSEMTGLHIKPMMWGGVIVGGIFFGVCIAVFRVWYRHRCGTTWRGEKRRGSRGG